MENQSKYQTFATVLSASILPCGLAVEALTSAFLKLSNPYNIDIWRPQAYAFESLVATIIVMVVLLGLALLLIQLINKVEGTLFGSARLPIAVTVFSVVFTLTILAGQGLTRLAEDNWTRANDGPSREVREQQLEQFYSESAE